MDAFDIEATRDSALSGDAESGLPSMLTPAPLRRVLLVALSGSLLAALYTYVEGKFLHAVIHV